MKKQLSFMNKDGFILPYTLFIAAIVVLIIMSSINIYRQHIQITHKSIEQIKLQTLFQMGRTKIKQELPNLNMPTDKLTYSFPDGDVEVEYITYENEYHLYFSIYTKDNSVYKTLNRLSTRNIDEQ